MFRGNPVEKKESVVAVEENKELVRRALASGLDFMDLVAEDAEWVIPGFGTYRGKREIIDKLITPVEGLMESMGSSVITNMVAEGDYVVVEFYAKDRRTKAGKPYNNTYCLVYKIVDGLIRHMTEYADTALAERVFSGEG
jgi:ketosteroid isomerase-like protein